MIIKVTSDSIQLAAEIHAEAWRASHSHFCTPEFVALHTTERQTKYLKSELAAGKKLYLLVADKPVGIISVWGDMIENLYVLPTEQRKGYGRMLLEFAAAQCTVPRLWVLDNNTTAIKFYRALGYEFTGNARKLSSELSELEMTATK